VITLCVSNLIAIISIEYDLLVIWGIVYFIVYAALSTIAVTLAYLIFKYVIITLNNPQ